MNHTISIESDGSIQTLWTDKLDLQDLGALSMRRASNIEFCPIGQDWAVFIGDSAIPYYRNRSREACIAWEIEYFNNQLMK